MLTINLKGKIAFIAGVGDDQGYGFAIAKRLYQAGATIIFGTWTPILKIFQTSWEKGKFDESRKLDDGSLMECAKIYALDAAYDSPEDVPEELKTNKRYASASGYTISEVAAQIEKDFGKIDIMIHSLANAPEVKKPLIETSRAGYLAAQSSSSYSFVSMVAHFGKIMNKGGSCLNLSYMASTHAIPGYGGGMSSAKASLESDTRTLAYEAGRRYGIRVNCISAGPLRSRAAKAIGFIDAMIEYSKANAPLQTEMTPDDVGASATFLCSDLAQSITGTILFVDKGMHAMGLAVDSPTLESLV
ncbi:MAG: enoyl-[acyl-carrier-protein] reductase [Rhabdochlamydiaceae bacterium]|nr:enoyl-[acyl-carrier-protein] reductase [Candidatus Amphrikana amoebophyrae]